ncbi:MAG: hypothetical protein F4145_13120 [Boseongicola sp. SB0675_bin_26]|nr:hypothetical protein [Boseongicola sp. SB0675_bin_26]
MRTLISLPRANDLVSLAFSNFSQMEKIRGATAMPHGAQNNFRRDFGIVAEPVKFFAYLSPLLLFVLLRFRRKPYECMYVSRAVQLQAAVRVRTNAETKGNTPEVVRIIWRRIPSDSTARSCEAIRSGARFSKVRMAPAPDMPSHNDIHCPISRKHETPNESCNADRPNS